MLTYTDRALTCVDCGQQFAFSASDQQFYADRQFSDPRRCPSCRAIRKASRDDSGPSGSGGGRYSGAREMFSATCASCGREAQVPFRPTGTKPVYCRDCYADRRS